MRVLLACEESQAVCKEFRKLGHEAYSCDIQPCSGGHPEWHIQDDVLKVLTQFWDLVIAFPPCTYITCSAEWAYKEPHEINKKLSPDKLYGSKRSEARIEAINFFMALYNCPAEKVAIENPVGVMSSRFRKPDQIIHPWMFSDDASKKTCLWLRGLRPLVHGKIIPPKGYQQVMNGGIYKVSGYEFSTKLTPAPRPVWGNQTASGQNKLPPSKDRAKLRSKTYPGIAKAMAEQWGRDGEDDVLFSQDIWSKLEAIR